MPEVRSCPWCGKLVAMRHNSATYCPDCRHRADCPHAACDCASCRQSLQRQSYADRVLPRRMHLLAEGMRELSPEDRLAIIKNLPKRIENPHNTELEREELTALLRAVE